MTIKCIEFDLSTSHPQLHVSHRGAQGVHRTAVIRARVGLCQVVHQQLSLPLFVYDFTPVLLG